MCPIRWHMIPKECLRSSCIRAWWSRCRSAGCRHSISIGSWQSAPHWIEGRLYRDNSFEIFYKRLISISKSLVNSEEILTSSLLAGMGVECRLHLQSGIVSRGLVPVDSLSVHKRYDGETTGQQYADHVWRYDWLGKLHSIFRRAPITEHVCSDDRDN